MLVNFSHYTNDGGSVTLQGHIIETFYEPGDPIPAHVIKELASGKLFTVDCQDAWPVRD